MHTMLFAFLDEMLFVFCTELLVFKEIRVTSLDKASWRIDAIGCAFSLPVSATEICSFCPYVHVPRMVQLARRKGEKFDRRRHSSGTEIKAITYSAMQVTEQTARGDAETFVIVDI